MNNDLISREALKATIDSYIERHETTEKDRLLFEGIKAFIDNAPTVEPTQETMDAYAKGFKAGFNSAKRPQGEWLGNDDNSITCNLCNCRLWVNDILDGNAFFCPNCGADMCVFGKGDQDGN